MTSTEFPRYSGTDTDREVTMTELTFAQREKLMAIYWTSPWSYTDGATGRPDPSYYRSGDTSHAATSVQRSLVDMGLVSLADDGECWSFHVTDAGRQLVDELRSR